MLGDTQTTIYKIYNKIKNQVDEICKEFGAKKVTTGFYYLNGVQDKGTIADISKSIDRILRIDIVKEGILRKKAIMRIAAFRNEKGRWKVLVMYDYNTFPEQQKQVLSKILNEMEEHLRAEKILSDLNEWDEKIVISNVDLPDRLLSRGERKKRERLLKEKQQRLLKPRK